MDTSNKYIRDLTVDEFVTLIQNTVRQMLQDTQPTPTIETHPQAGLLDIEPLSIGEWNPEHPFISREEYYDDE